MLHSFIFFGILTTDARGQRLTLAVFVFLSGVDVPRLGSFVEDYFAAQRKRPSGNAGPSTLTGQTLDQNVDAAFMSFVWSMLVQQDDVKVGVWTTQAVQTATTSSAGASHETAETKQDAAQARPSNEIETAAEQLSSLKDVGKQSADDKGKGKLLDDNQNCLGADEAGFVELGPHERSMPQDQLVAKYGGRLRIAADAEARWVAITGSSMRVCTASSKLVTNMLISLL